MYFRVDANKTVAAGHLMRCLSIADAARKMGEGSVFLLAGREGEKLVADRGYRSIVLGTDWQDMEAELPVLLECIRREKITSLLVDSYRVTPAYLEELRKRVFTAYIDDVNAFVYPVDMLICYAGYYRSFGYGGKYPDTRLLTGTAYAPLRQEYSACGPKEIAPVAERLLLLSGGGGKYDLLYRIAEGLARGGYKRITVICGRFSEAYDRLRKDFDKNPSVIIRKNINNLKAYMEEADIAITAAGATLYELCAAGTPAVTYVLAENQQYNAQWFEQEGLAPCAGRAWDGAVAEGILRLTGELAADPQGRRRRSLAMQSYVDGKGAKRIAEELLARCAHKGAGAYLV